MSLSSIENSELCVYFKTKVVVVPQQLRSFTTLHFKWDGRCIIPGSIVEFTMLPGCHGCPRLRGAEKVQI
jgi:hypothetical protein